MRIEEAVKSTLIGAAVSMHLTPGKKKGAGFGQAKDVPGKEHPTADPSLMVLRSLDSMAVHRTRLTRQRDSGDSCRVQVGSDDEEEEEGLAEEGAGRDASSDQQSLQDQSAGHGNGKETVNSQEADAVGTSDDSRSNPTAQDRQPATRKDMHAPADGGKPEEGLGTRLSLLVQREDSLSLAHRRMSGAGSPHSRHSMSEIRKGGQRQSRFHFQPADLLPTETFHHVTGSIKALYHRSMSLNLRYRRRSSPARGANSASSSPLHRTGRRPSLKSIHSEGGPTLRAQGSGQLPDSLGRDGLPEAPRPHRSSLKMSRQASLELCGLDFVSLEPASSRRVSVHFG